MNLTQAVLRWAEAREAVIEMHQSIQSEMSNIASY